MDKLSTEARIVVALTAVFSFVAALVFAFVFVLAIVGVNLAPWPILAVAASSAVVFVTWQTGRVRGEVTFGATLANVVLGIIALSWPTIIEWAQFVYVSCLLQIAVQLVLAFASVMAQLPEPEMKAKVSKKSETAAS